jgi:hypothetical protein
MQHLLSSAVLPPAVQHIFGSSDARIRRMLNRVELQPKMNRYGLICDRPY